MWWLCSASKLCRRRFSSLSAQAALGALRERDLVQQSTRVCEDAPTPGSSVYIGFDPTADSLHIGNLIGIVALLHFKRAGFRPIAVVGGATGLVGDPSGRTKERDCLPQESLERNLAGITSVLHRVFDNHELLSKSEATGPQLKVLNNADWWSGVSSVQFVSDIARHFRLTAMLAKESVKQRLDVEEGGMSCAEFLYPVFQAYDFLQLHRHYNCWLQIGGGDQWGNISAGCDFVKRATGNTVHGLTLPLLTNSAGEKFGKSAGNAVWLSAERTSCYELYQYFVGSSDQDVERLLKSFTLLPLGHVEEVMAEHSKCPEKFIAQKCLAESVLTLVHGAEGLEQAVRATDALFGGPGALARLSECEIGQLFCNAPSYELSIARLSSGLTLAQLAAESGAVASLEAAERLIKSGGLYVNSERVHLADDHVTSEHLLPGNITLLRTGKKKYSLVRWR